MKTSFTANTSSLHYDLAHGESALPSDADLMTAIQAGDTAALETLFHRYQALLKGTIRRIINDDFFAQDIVQECLLELWRRSHHYSAAKGAPLAWLLTLARRRAIDHIRRSQAYGRACTRYEDATNAMPSSHDATADCEQTDLGNVLSAHLKRLPEPQQHVIALAFLQGMSQREVAQATHLPLGTVKTRMELGLKKLRRSFGSFSAIHSYQAA
ncbi:sigma-70 family RNA polymerase sigma factor [Prosthecobacter sp.]|uniref:RNA polymerase sigma factor n=1 Tax=Prosthecobacter sp. TaxID=1965333 RepID=UPI002ABD12B5|nr:sigma-70 family RNA polymerase sigma factor [Prosthecobacter sp.]MDZ4401168.1 sigma-70 family RNA polymerase sigma factor [Prosthecobacter sp.]